MAHSAYRAAQHRTGCGMSIRDLIEGIAFILISYVVIFIVLAA